MLELLIGVPSCSQMILKLAKFEEIWQVIVTESFDLRFRIFEVGWAMNLGKVGGT